ncbi:MAG: hypothetical protein KF746_16220 [Chitinophagaceae bacterium]|nr:hypothetical protein [Chitinophagaceae bacterium]
MKYKALLEQSRQNIGIDFPVSCRGISFQVFETGCRWMHQKLNDDAGERHRNFNSSINYLKYGMIKYGIAFFVFFFSLWQFSRISLFIAPLSIVLFYLVEIHFLFLFPFILDGIENPLWASLKQTYKTGIVTALITVIPIGLFMLYGLLNIRNPFRNWYIGCFAIIIWYQNEVKDRL